MFDKSHVESIGTDTVHNDLIARSAAENNAWTEACY